MAAAPIAAVLALGRAGKVGQRDSDVVILCPLAGWFPRRLSAGAGVAAELRPCEGSGHDNGHPVILAARRAATASSQAGQAGSIAWLM